MAGPSADAERRRVFGAGGAPGVYYDGSDTTDRRCVEELRREHAFVLSIEPKGVISGCGVNGMDIWRESCRR